MAGLGIDAAPHVLERDGEIAGDAGHHGVGVAERDHAGGEMIAVLVDQALAVALQKTVALQPLVEIRGIGGIARGQRRVDDRDAAAELDAERLRRLAHAALAADQERAAEPLVHEARRRADHLLLFALGEDDAPRLPAQPLKDAAAARRRSDRAGCAIAGDRRPCRRSACGRRPVSIAAFATAGGTVEISRGSNGTGMM